MKALLTLMLCSCAYTARPIDLIHPGPPMCNPINEDVWDCRAADGTPWRCDVTAGRWACYQLEVR